MRTSHIKTIACAVAALLLSSLSFAQVTKSQEEANLGIEAHVGKLTGHAKDAAMNYRRYCAGCHGDLGDGEGETLPGLIPTRATSLWLRSNVAPLPAGPCLPMKTCTTPWDAGWKVPTCRPGIHYLRSSA